MSLIERSLHERRFVLLAIVAAWLAAWLWLTRFHQLDDALIFMRYAELLEQHGILTFDGANQSWGVSSLGFLGLSVLLHVATGSTLAAKWGSMLACAATVALAAREWTRTHALEQFVWGTLVVVLVSPMGLRWTTDGMDTSLVLLMTLALGLSAWRVAASPTRTPGRYLALLGLGAFVVWVRLEFALMIFFAVLASWLFAIENEARDGDRPTASRVVGIALRESHLAIGGVVGLILIRVVLGGFVPETAAAKLTAPTGVFYAAYRILQSCATSLSLGTGALGLWAFSFALAARVAFTERRGRAALLVMNAALPFLIVLIGVRGQNVQGIRHVLWIFFLLIPWNARMISVAPQVAWDWLMAWLPGESLRRRAAVAVAVAWVALWVFEGALVWRVASVRAQAFLDMQGHELEVFSDQLGIAFDVGFVS